MAADMLCGPDSFVGQVMDRATVRALLDSHERGRTNEEMRLWALLSLEVWHSRYFGADRRSAAAPAPAARS
jgi:asparagine synthase (glutamine-hydrolysing)